MNLDPKPKRLRVFDSIVIGVSKSGRYYPQKSDKHRVDSSRTNKRGGGPLGYVGAWRLTGIKTKSPDDLLADIGVELELKRSRNRRGIICKLMDMNAVRARDLKPNQLQTFLNFLLKLKP